MTEDSFEDEDYIKEAFSRPSKKQEVAFALNSFYILLFGTWGFVQLYAVTVLLIPLFFIPIMYLIYSIVDSVNDPLIGYYTDRSKRFTEKYGKRFPWIVVGTIFTPILVLLIYFPPVELTSDPNSVILVVIWMILILCLFETFATLREVSQVALFPDLFRYKDQRSAVLGIGMLFTLIAQLIMAVSIPLIMASLGGATERIAFIGATLFILILIYVVSIPYLIWGVRETHEMKQFRLRLDQEIEVYEPVLKVYKRIIKDRNWMGLIISFLIWGSGGLCFLGGGTYFVLFYLGLGIEVTALPGLLLLTTATISIPFWLKLSKKISLKNFCTFGMALSAIGFFLYWFVEDYTGWVIMSAFMGIVWSGVWGITFGMVQAEAIDNAAVINGKREEASYSGLFRVFSAFTYFFQSLIFFIVWTLTGYEPAKRAEQTELARLGLKLLVSIIPATLAAIAILVFVMMYTISKEDAIQNKQKLAEMKL